MRAMSRLHRSRLASATALVGAALLLAPPPAVADDDDWEEDRGRGWYGRSHRHGRGPYYGGHVHQHGDWCPPRRHKRRHVHHHHYVPYGYAPYGYAPYAYYAPPPPRRSHRYYCEPCDHWYGTEVSFHTHIHADHGVSRALIPAVVVATVFGAIFAGR